MKQILQSFKTGITELSELPSPTVKPGQVLIQTTRSLVSLGTEKMLVEFGKASLIQKAKQQPEKVKMVLDKIRTEGLMPTIETVFNQYDTSFEYSSIKTRKLTFSSFLFHKLIRVNTG